MSKTKTKCNQPFTNGKPTLLGRGSLLQTCQGAERTQCIAIAEVCGWDKCAIYLLQLLSNGALALIHCPNDGQRYQKYCDSMNTGSILWVGVVLGRVAMRT